MGCFSGSLVEQLIHVPKGYCRGPGLAPLQPVPTCYLLTFSLFHLSLVIRIVFPPVSLWFTLLNSGSSVTVKSSHDNDMLACGRECVQDLHMNKTDQLAIRHERLTGWSPVQAVHTENQPFPVSG